MSGMSDKAHEMVMQALGYDDTYVATPDSRRMYQALLGMPAELGKYVGLRGNAIAISSPSAHNKLIEEAVDLVTEVIAKASYRSAVAVKRQRALGRHILGIDNKKAGDV